jgi:uncharacterized protein (TIGR02246 family)
MPAHRRISGLLATIVMLASASMALASEPSAEEANSALAKAFESAWNAHDMKAFGQLLTEDVVWINVDAGRGTGREMVESGHAKVHAGKFKNSVLTVKNVEVQSLKPDVAIVLVSWAIRGDTDNDGTPRQPREGLFTWVTVKQGADWKIRSSHNTNRNMVR